MRIGVYCGSFDPLHKGHEAIIRECLKQDLCDKVLLVPTGNYWDKQNISPLALRLQMAEVLNIEGLLVERDLNDIPYTYLLFRELKKRYPDDSLHLILGGDNLRCFSRWKHYREMLCYPFIIMPREPYGEAFLKRKMAVLDKSDYVIMKMPMIDISSSYIRQHINDPQAIAAMIDEKAADLYRQYLNNR
ncbi:MAG: nicotinate-nicotinamide nucleotide adenylyltransferase [Erysipelotrichaceae bacterium]|nr:nicotinate-nicotinamide nucleotide adenylyltransferase [Erysipelotrichaceae bacterium]